MLPSVEGIPLWLDSPEQVRWVDRFGVWELRAGAPRRLHSVPAATDVVTAGAIYAATSGGVARTSLVDGHTQLLRLPACTAEGKRNSLLGVADDGVLLWWCGDRARVVGAAGAITTTVPTGGSLVGLLFATTGRKAIGAGG